MTNPEMRKIAAKHNVPVVLMHMKGTPKTMQQDPTYQDLLGEITAFFQEQITKAQKEGIQQIIIDPGIGFGKTVEHNLQILKHLECIQDAWLSDLCWAIAEILYRNDNRIICKRAS